MAQLEPKSRKRREKDRSISLGSQFRVENFVGTYHLEFDSKLGEQIIISEEFNHATGKELPLQRKCLVELSRRKDIHLCKELANVDLSSPQSILDYCNKYGLPVSSQIAYDRYQWLGADVEKTVADKVALSGNWKYLRNDSMTLAGFCRFSTMVRGLLRLRELSALMAFNDKSYTEFMSILIFFLFFSHEEMFDYRPSEEELPRTRIMRLQYLFQLFRRKNNLFEYGIDEQIVCFVNHCHCLQSCSPAELESKHIIADVHSTAVKQILDIITEFLSPHVDSDGFTEYKHDIFYSQYGKIEFEKELKWDKHYEEQRALCRLAVDVICSAINFGLDHIAPTLVIDESRTVYGGWILDGQMQGIYMELFLDLTKNSEYKLCANPTCGKFFVASDRRSDAIYCSAACASLQAQRARRSRSKQTNK